MGAKTVIVGVGQLRCRPGLDGDFDPQEPAVLMARVLEHAAGDARAPGLLGEADLLVTVAPIAWRYDDCPGVVADRLGLRPREGLEPAPGGESPIAALNAVANRIQSGELRCALLTGAETMYSRRRARREGRTLEHWTPMSESKDWTGGQRPIANPLELRHGMFLPIQTYPLYENALRAESGRGIEEHQRFLGGLMARYSEVAARNPCSWFPEPRDARRISEVSKENRWVCFPYPKLMNAIMEVDQAAACIVMADDEADRLGIGPERRVGYLGGAKATDAWTPTERIDFVSSPAYRAAAERALALAALSLDEVERFDLYSCFPSAVQLALKALALEWDDPRVPTTTGGLAHHGGPGNNYSMHSLANMVEHLRRSDESVGWVSGLGMTATKHAVSVLSNDPARVRAAEGTSELLELPAQLTHGPELVDAPDGPGEIETYTVQFDRRGRPERSFIVVRLTDGRRSLAHGEPADFDRLLESEGVGLVGKVAPGEGSDPNVFILG